mgnify:CR=1 FL=1
MNQRDVKFTLLGNSYYKPVSPLTVQYKLTDMLDDTPFVDDSVFSVVVKRGSKLLLNDTNLKAQNSILTLKNLPLLGNLNDAKPITISVNLLFSFSLFFAYISLYI